MVEVVREIEHQGKVANPKSVARYIRRHPATLSRILKRLEMTLPRTRRKPRQFPERQRQGLALFFLGINRDQIRRLTGIKSQTIAHWLLDLTIPSQPTHCRIFDENKLKLLAGGLERNFGMGEEVRQADVIYGPQFPLKAKEFLSLMKSAQREAAFHGPDFIRKLRKILKRNVTRKSGFVVTTDFHGHVFEIPVKSL